MIVPSLNVHTHPYTSIYWHSDVPRPIFKTYAYHFCIICSTLEVVGGLFLVYLGLLFLIQFASLSIKKKKKNLYYLPCLLVTWV